MSHPERTSRVMVGILGQLNREWAALSLRDHRAAVKRWAALHPALATCRSLSDIVRLVEGRAGHNDAELAALIALSQSGDPLAGQVLTHVLIGPACRLASRTRTYADDLEGSRCQAVGAMWTAVRQYNLGARRNHVTGLTLDALRLITRRPRSLAEVPTEWTDLREPDPSDGSATLRDRFWAQTLPDPGADMDGELGQLLRWAVDGSVITATHAMILWRMHGPNRITSALIGQDLGVSASAVRERSRWALNAVAVAVRDHLHDVSHRAA